MITRSLQKYKHIVDASFVNTANTVTQATAVASGADNPIITSPTSVQARARIKAIYMEVTFANNTIKQNFHWIMWARPQSALSSPTPNTTGQSTAKSYIFKSGMVSLDTVGQGPSTTTVRGIIKVPSKYQRLMNSDAIYFSYVTDFGAANTDNVTCKFIYKEVRG